jgi:hypothetical protein
MKGSNLRCEPIWHLAALQYKMSILAFTGTVVGKGMLEVLQVLNFRKIGGIMSDKIGV